VSSRSLRAAALLLSAPALLVPAVSAQQPRAQRSPLDATLYGVVYDVPATASVILHADVPYLGSGRDALTLDIYLPPGWTAGQVRPGVVFLNAIGDAPGQDKVKHWGIYRSWPRLVAAMGMVGISMDAHSERIQESLRAVFAFLAREGASQGVDGSRLGVYAASANVSGASTLLLSDSAPAGIKAAVLYYGRPPAQALRRDLPVLFVPAEGDAPGAGPDLGALWQRVVEARAPWTLLFASRLPHAFDAFSDNDDARRVIQETIAFWKAHLEPVPQPTWSPSPARAIVAASYDGAHPERLLELLPGWLAEHPNDIDALLMQGRALQRAQRWTEVATPFERAYVLDSTRVGVLAGLGQTRLGQQRWADAADLLARAIARGARNSLMFGQLGWAQLHLGRNAEAVASYERAFQEGIPPGASTRGVAYYNLACGYARLGRRDQAWHALEQAVAEGYSNRASLETDPDLAPLRSEARFTALLARLPAATP
jgi:tetratricopeptide (TPR) repeat protein